MSNAPKPVTLRLIVPKTISTRVLNSLGPGAKVQAKDLVLNTSKLSTNNIVQSIKEYSKLRDELSQTLRQLGISREGKQQLPELSNLDSRIEEARRKLDDIRVRHQKMQAETDSLERRAEDIKKQITSGNQLADTGFSFDEIASQIPGFRRIIGRLPVKKTEAAQKALQALLKERTIVAAGTKKQDWIYLLVASPTDAAPQVLQTLLLYEFIPTDIPRFEGSSLAETLMSWKQKSDRITKEVEAKKAEMKVLSETWADSLNELADESQEIILMLRSALRLGEGTNAAHIYARLEKPPPPETLNALVKDGILEVE